MFIGRTGAEAETPILWPPDAKNWLIGKDPDAGKDWRQEEKGATEDEIVGWHHWLDGHGFESALHIRWPKYWGSASTSVLPVNIQDCFPLGWTGWISLQSKGLHECSPHHSSKASILQHSAFFIVQLSYPYKTTKKTIVLTRWTFVGKVMSLLFNMLSRLVITFLPRSKCLLISWLQSPSAVILEPPK